MNYFENIGISENWKLVFSEYEHKSMSMVIGYVSMGM